MCLMKTRLLALISVAALFAGCAKEVDVNTPTSTGKRQVTITANILQTKSTVSDAGIYSWSSDEQIAVAEEGMTGATPIVFDIQDADEGTFSGTLTGSNNPVFAISPAFVASNFTTEGGNTIYDIVLDNISDYVPGTTNALMIGTLVSNSNYKFEFRHAAALVKVPVVNVPAGTAKIKLTMDKPITGLWGSVATVNPIPEIAPDTNLGENSLTLTLKDVISASNTSADFFFPVPANTYTSFQFELLDANGNRLKGVKKTGLSIKLDVADLFVTPTITAVETFSKVKSTADLKDGKYLIVYEGGKNTSNVEIPSVAFDGSKNSLDAVKNGISVTIDNDVIAATTELKASIFVISVSDGTIKSASGKYIGQSSYANGLATDETNAIINSISIDGEENAVIGVAVENNSVTLRYNYSSDQLRFRYYKSGQQPIALYLLNDGSATTPTTKQEAGLSWSAENASASIEDGDVINFTAPTLSNPNSVSPVTYESTDTDVAEVSAEGDVTIKAGGETTIKAIFAGDAAYKSQTVSYTLTVTDNRTPVVSYDFETIAELNTLVTSSGDNTKNNAAVQYNGKLTSAVVSFRPDENNAIIKDATGSILVFKNSHGLLQGQTFSGEVTVSAKLYYTTVEITAIDASFTGSQTEVLPETVSLSQLEGNFSTYQNAYVKVEGLTVTARDAKNITVSDGTKTYLVYDNANASTAGVGDVITAVGTVADHNGTNQIKVWASSDITVTGSAPKAITFSQPTGAAATAGCSFKVKVDGSEITSGTTVASGKTVTLEATVGTDYTFEGWTVTGAEVANASALTTTFEMGTSAVNVSASFKSDKVASYVDVLTQSWTEVSGTSYTNWTGKAGSASSAVYAGNSAGDNSSIQLRSNNSNSGVVSTTSGGKVKKIKVTWNSNTSSGRTLNIYGKNSAYSQATDLYNNSNQGTLLGTIVCGTSTELTITGDYTFVGFRSASGAMYLDKVDITWEN